MKNSKLASNKKMYGVSFNTTKRPGYLSAVMITIEEDVLDMDETVNVDLADHPCYKDLQAYVKANPR